MRPTVKHSLSEHTAIFSPRTTLTLQEYFQQVFSEREPYAFSLSQKLDFESTTKYYKYNDDNVASSIQMFLQLKVSHMKQPSAVL